MRRSEALRQRPQRAEDCETPANSPEIPVRRQNQRKRATSSIRFGDCACNCDNTDRRDKDIKHYVIAHIARPNGKWSSATLSPSVLADRSTSSSVRRAETSADHGPQLGGGTVAFAGRYWAGGCRATGRATKRRRYRPLWLPGRTESGTHLADCFADRALKEGSPVG